MDTRPTHRLEIRFADNPPGENEPDMLILDLENGVFVRLNLEGVRSLIEPMKQFIADATAIRTRKLLDKGNLRPKGDA